jgi:tyrosinase
MATQTESPNASVTVLAHGRRSFVAKKNFAGKVTVRKDVREMQPQEIVDFRLAVAGMAAISAQVPGDNRGFQYIAGIHGIPQFHCAHGIRAFALWHRPYVQMFEQAMQDIVPTAYLPYWNWSEQFEIPHIFTEKTWHNPKTGKTEPNPLLAQPMHGGAPTTRKPGPTAKLQRIGAKLAEARMATTYDNLHPDLEGPHNGLHLWVGGDMQSTDTAAYDPVFWAHHSFVEYVFCDWQDAHPGAHQPKISASDFVPFGVTVDDIWLYKDLGYVYDPYSPVPMNLGGKVENVATAANTADAAMLPVPTLASGTTISHFALHTLEKDFTRAEVRFEGLTPPDDSFEVRVFVNEPKATAKTATDGNKNYLGSQHFFGHGGCFGAPGHCEPAPRDIFDLRPKHHYDPIYVRLNVTKPLRALVNSKEAGTKDAPVTLVVVDRDGKEIKDSGLHFEGFSLVLT